MNRSRLLFGIFPTPDASRFDETVRQVQLADALGLDLVGVQDHPYQRRFLDTFALMPVLLARTERIVVFPDVANLRLRGASILAKTAASLDVMFPGRFVMGLGAGAFSEAVQAMGGPRMTPGEAVVAFDEAVAVMRALWSGERGLKVPGRFHRLEGAHSGPVPTRPLEIWSGAAGRKMLELTGRLCDGWIPSSPYFPPSRLERANRVIDQAAEAAGRDAASIRRLYNVGGVIRPGPPSGFLEGDQEHWVAEITSLVDELGVSGFLLMVGEDGENQIRAFAEIASHLRTLRAPLSE